MFKGVLGRGVFGFSAEEDPDVSVALCATASLNLLPLADAPAVPLADVLESAEDRTVVAVDLAHGVVPDEATSGRDGVVQAVVLGVVGMQFVQGDIEVVSDADVPG